MAAAWNVNWMAGDFLLIDKCRQGVFDKKIESTIDELNCCVVDVCNHSHQNPFMTDILQMSYQQRDVGEEIPKRHESC